MSDEPVVPDAAAPAPPEGDGELKAMNAIVAALKPLTEEERRRVLEYVLGRFGALPLQPTVASVSATSATTSASAPPSAVGGIHDIRSLKEAKGPKSANEMAALVAYYVSELAPAAERKQEINKIDIERYFKTAGYKLTANAGMTLVNAKHAGYLDGGSGPGQYRLNPVGYNLIVHRLSGEKQPRRRARANKKSRGK